MAPTKSEMEAMALQLEPEIGAWQFTVVVKCPCGDQFLWTGHPRFNGVGTVQQCTCKRMYTVARMPNYNDSGLIEVRLLHAIRP